MQSREKGLITKERMVMHMHLNFVFKWALHFSILYISNESLHRIVHNCKCNTMSQSPFACFATCTTHPLLKIKASSC